jgi:hypothetical protein
MKRVQLFSLFVFFYSISILSCNDTEKPAAVSIAAPDKPELMAPFRYHKMIEVSPGQDYDVVSWGRGANTVGAFAILHSDSAAAKYTTTTGDLNGVIVDVFNTDMDLDGNPEIIIQAKTTDTVNYTHIYAYEFNNSKAQSLDFPKLTQQQRQGYRGKDNFYVQDGKLVREFPIFEGGGKDARPTSQKRQLEYGMRDNELYAKQLSKDSTSVKSPIKPVVSATVNKPKTEKHSSVKKKKKKHKRHRDEDDN